VFIQGGLSGFQENPAKNYRRAAIFGQGISSRNVLKHETDARCDHGEADTRPLENITAAVRNGECVDLQTPCDMIYGAHGEALHETQAIA
jgi:hypothetical protein